MSDIKLKTPAAFADEFMQWYCENGMGSMGKRDIDILVFYLLLQDGRYKLPKDIFKACRELKLTESKVRNLYQEAQLRHMQYGIEDAKSKFASLVTNGMIESKGERLTFIVRDPLLRQYFEEWVADQDGFTDSSFNKNLVTIHRETFAAVLEGLTTVKFGDIKGQFKDELAPMNEATSQKGLMRLFAEELAKSAGKEAGSMSLKAIGTGIKLLVLGAI